MRTLGPLALSVVLVAVLAGCPEYTLVQNSHQDIFTQESRKVVDILLVVDNSCSMIDEQEKLAGSFQNFIDSFAEVDVDYQIGVVTTDQEQEHHGGRLRCSADVVGTEIGPFLITRDVTDTLELGFGADLLEHQFEWSLLEEYCEVDGDAATCTAELVDELVTYYFIDYAYGSATEDGVIWITTELPCTEATLDVGNGGLNEVIGIEAGYTMSGVRLITPETANAAAHFAANVHVGNRGSGWEQGLEGAFTALSDPLLTADNAGFLRDDAALSIVFVSDEEDKSPDPVEYYLDFYYAVKSPVDGWEAYRDETLLNISAVVGDIPEGCEQELGGDVYPAQPGYRYIDLATRTGGIYDSICNVDFSPMVQELGLNISGLRKEFFLSRYPDETTLELTIDEQALAEGWLYDCEDNSVVFDDSHIPSGNATIVVSYTVVPRPVDGPCSGGEES